LSADADYLPVPTVQ